MVNITLGSSNFHKFVQKDVLFVDKSLLIKQVLSDHSDVILITRPRRWGKSLDLSMLYHFFSANANGEPTKGLFDALEIASVDNGHYMQYQGQYPVIFINLKEVAEQSYEGAIANIYAVVRSLFAEFSEILKSDRVAHFDKVAFEEIISGKANQQFLQRSLFILSQCLKTHYGKNAYILIDEYDKPLNHAYQYDYFDEFSNFMKGFLSAGFKDNPYLEKGIMTGVLRLSKANMLSGLNNLREYTLLDNTYAKYFGFTEDEVTDAFKKTGLSHDLEKVKAWYNGYNIGGLVIYNPWSIMSCIQNNGELCPYWVETADNSLIEESIMNASEKIQQSLKLLLAGEVIEVTIQRHVTFDYLTKDPVALWSLLLFTGYLRIDEIVNQGEMREVFCRVRVPNTEVMQLFTRLVTHWFLVKARRSTFTREYLADLLAGNVSGFTNTIQDYLTHASFHDTGEKSEMFYHGFVLALVVQLRKSHHIYSNRESGDGRYDVAIFPKTASDGDLGILLEFKRVKETAALEVAAQEALRQINEKHYDTELKQHAHIKRLIRIGMAFSGKAVLSVYN